jgi:hypothetical protein
MKAFDRIKPIKLDSVDLLKNFRGEVTIELKDVKTGKTETVQDHNMVTNALSYFFKQGGITNRSPFNAGYINSNAIYYLMGGMMCLDTALTEDPEIVRVPAGVKMTANGARDQLNSGSPTELGSYNVSESGWQQDGSLKMVWDFTTSQGNGTIASVCLSSAFGGFRGIGNVASDGAKGNPWDISNWNSSAAISGISGLVLGYKDNMVYTLNTIAGVDKWTINRYRFPYKNFDVRDSMTARLVDTIEIPIPALIQNLPTSGDIRWSNGYCKVTQQGTDVYIIATAAYHGNIGAYWSAYFSDSYPAYCIKYDMAAGTVTAQALTPTNTGIPAKTTGFAFATGISNKWAIIGTNCVNLANLADVHDIENATEQPQTGTFTPTWQLSTVSQDVFYINDDRGQYRYDLVTFKRMKVNGTYFGGLGNMPDNPLFRFSGSQITRDPNYIATIFNLDSPKVKDASKMMKVTYLLRFDAQA